MDAMVGTLRYVAIIGCVASCGRIGFDPLQDGTGDAGRDGGGSAATDTMLPAANDTCMTAVDVTMGGSFSGSTCGSTDDYTLACAANATPDVYYTIVITMTTGIPVYDVFVTSGFVVSEYEDTTCTAMPASPICGITSIAAQANRTYVLVVERTAGGCGTFTLDIVIR
jgi:hypothetical protein